MAESNKGAGPGRLSSAELLSRLRLETPPDASLSHTLAARHISSSLQSLFAPPDRLPLSSWAELNLQLSSEYAARTGPLRLIGWQRGIFDSFTDPYTREITLCCGTQLIKTLFIQCAMAYVMVETPGPMLIVMPTDEDAKAFSKERLDPMIRDNQVLSSVISETHHDGSNTLKMKSFPGGSLALVGGRVPGNVARRSIRFGFYDEINKYPASVGGKDGEGDALSLGRERLATYMSRSKSIYTCSPTDSFGRITTSYQSSDRRRPWVPCWKCGVYQVLDFHHQVKFDTGASIARRAESSHYQCANHDCQAPWTDVQRWASCQKAEWRADGVFTGHAGFWINHLYSPWKKLSQIVGDFLRMKDHRNQLKVFVNTNLAEVWIDKGETPSQDALFHRRETYPYGDSAVIPQQGLFLTSAVDVQDNPPRLEVETVAWGRGRENWSIDYRIIAEQSLDGEPLPVTSQKLWDRLKSEVLDRNWLHASGRTLPIMVMVIDTGSKPKPVYNFALRHPRLNISPSGLKPYAVRTVVPIKGTDDPLKIISGVSKEDAARKRQNIRIVHIGTHCAKQEIYDSLRAIRPNPPVQLEDGTGTFAWVPTPDCYHFPMYTLEYFEGLSSETRIVDEDSGKVEYRKIGARNEPLDLKVYNRGAAAIVGIDRFTEDHWRQMEKQVGGQAPATAPTTATAPVTVPVPSQVQPQSQSPVPVQSSSQSRVRRSRGSFV